MDSLDIVRTAVADVLGVDAAEITPETTAHDVDGWDSLNHVTILLFVSRRAGVTFTDEESDSLETVGDLIRLIDSKRTV